MGIVKKSCTLFISIAYLVGPVYAQSSDLTEILQKYNQAMISELIYIHTDRDVYYKGDTIWFNAYVRNKADLSESSLSQIFTISLISEKGVNLVNGRYIIYDSQTHGQILLDKDVNEGYYYITAFSSWMKNFVYEEIYKKRIYISEDKREDTWVTSYFNKAGYYPGEEIRLKLATNDDYYEEPEILEYSYKVKVDRDVILKGDSDEQEIRFLYDTSFHSPPHIDVNGRKSTADLDTVIYITVNRELDISFYPEGGHCINGLTGQVAFKALYSDGRPANISGRIVDENGKEFSIAFTEHDGMGAFIFTPIKGKFYYFIPDSNPDHERFELPAGEDQGWKMEVNSISEELLEIAISNPSPVRENGFLLLQIRNSVIICKVFEIEKQLIISIPTDSIPVGVGVFSIIDSEFKVQAERLSFINYSKQNLIEIYSDSASYKPRDSTVVQIALADKDKQPLKGHFSFTAYNERIGSRGYFDEPDIHTTFYLLPEIKGHINNPDFYFKPENQNIERKLDLLLMTQGWRNYKYIVNTDSIAIPHSQEQISGRIKKYRKGKGMIPTKGYVNLSFYGNSTQIETNNEGSFQFTPIFEKGSYPDLFLSVGDKDDDNQYDLSLDNNEYIFDYIHYMYQNINNLKSSSPTPVYTYEYLDKITFNSTFTNQLLDEVKFKSRRKHEISNDLRTQVRNHPEVQKIPDGIVETSKDIEEILSRMDIFLLPFIYPEINTKAFMPGTKPSGHAIIGFMFDNPYCTSTLYSEVHHIKPERIDEMYIGKGNDLPPGGGFGFLWIYIFTKGTNGCAISNYFDNSEAKIVFDVVKEFYSPKYPSALDREREISDFRRTIHWQQTAETDNLGRSRISFFNADQNARIKCVVEGFGENNIPFRQEFYYTVHD